MRISDWSSDVCSSDLLTVFLITHDLDTLYAICDRVAVIADKPVIAVGTIDELLATDHPWIQEYLNVQRRRAAKTSLCGREVDADASAGHNQKIASEEYWHSNPIKYCQET